MYPTLAYLLDAGDQSRIFEYPVTNASEADDNPDPANIEALATIRGSFQIGSQYHYTMETQTTFCVPSDDGGIDVHSATQWIDFTQAAIAETLKIPQNFINMVVRRLGGGYGAKISRGTQIACASALACHLTRRPVRFVMTIESNMMVCGKRFACKNDYTTIVDSLSGKIREMTNEFVQDSGYTLNEALIPITGEAFQNCYGPNPRWLIKPSVAKTDAPSHTWCRAPNHCEGIAMIENIMEHIARDIRKDPADVRLANIRDDNPTKKIYLEFLKGVDYAMRKADIDKFNLTNRWRKRGIATVPMQYKLMYFGNFPTYVAIYHSDGTVVVTHGGIEMGQGINTKVAQVVAFALGIPLEFVRVKPSDNITGANAFVSGASVASESVCYVNKTKSIFSEIISNYRLLSFSFFYLKAAKQACEIILGRILPVRKTLPKEATWPIVTEACHLAGIDLTAKYDFKPSDAKPYDIVGCSCAEIELDILTGNLLINRVDIMEDTGDSMSPLVDVGQVEGAFIMGVGYWLSEELVYDRQTGELLTNRTWNYKPPGAKDIPIDFRISFPKNNPNSRAGVLRSKATGEPALCMAVVVQFAIRHALDSARKDNGAKSSWFQLGNANFINLIKMEIINFSLICRVIGNTRSNIFGS